MQQTQHSIPWWSQPRFRTNCVTCMHQPLGATAGMAAAAQLAPRHRGRPMAPGPPTAHLRTEEGEGGGKGLRGAGAFKERRPAQVLHGGAAGAP